MKPERQNPFWPTPPRAKRNRTRLIVVTLVIGLLLIAARFVLRIVWG